MTRSTRAALLIAAVASFAGARTAAAQDTTYRGITLVGNYDPSHDKFGIVVLPVSGAFADSIRTIVQRDLDYGDRFTIIPIDSTGDPSAWRGANGSGLNYSLFSRLNAVAVVQITQVTTGLHVALHDVAKGQVLNVSEFAMPSAALGRDWRMSIHRLSDEIERWVTGQRGISATRIAYMRGTGAQSAIRIVDSDGANEITVPTEEAGLGPSWNPAANTIAYTTYGANSRLLAIDLATGRSRTLAGPTRNIGYSSPVFMPDGNAIVFARYGDNGTDLYAMSAAGSDQRRLTSGRGVENSLPAPSPDGRRIVYTGNALGRPELYIMDADGTNAEVLTNYEDSERNYRSDPDWSPDGRMIAYQERSTGANGRFQIRTINPSGSAPKIRTSEGENEQPSWAPDSRHLVFTSSRTGVRQLWVMDLETGRVRQLTKSAGSRLAAWSPRMSNP